MDQLDLLGSAEQAELLVGAGARLHAVRLKVAQNGADARVGVLDVVDGVLAVLLDRKVEVKVHLGGRLACVEDEARAVDGHLVQQIAELDRLTGTLRHGDDLSVADELDQLHQQDIELVAVVADGVHRALEAHDMTVMVGAPDVDQLLEAAVEFILVIGDIGGEVGGVAVAADQHIVL